MNCQCIASLFIVGTIVRTAKETAKLKYEDGYGVCSLDRIVLVDLPPRRLEDRQG